MIDNLINNSIYISYMNGRYGEVSLELPIHGLTVLDPNGHSILAKCLIEALRCDSHSAFTVEGVGVSSSALVKRMLPHQFAFGQKFPLISLNESIKRQPPSDTVATLLSWDRTFDQLLARFGTLTCLSCGAPLPMLAEVGSSEAILTAVNELLAAGCEELALLGRTTSPQGAAGGIAEQLLTLAELGFRRFAVSLTSEVRRLNDVSPQAARELANQLLKDSPGGAHLWVFIERFQNADRSVVVDALRRAEQFSPIELVVGALVRPTGAAALCLELPQRCVFSKELSCPSCAQVNSFASAVRALSPLHPRRCGDFSQILETLRQIPTPEIKATTAGIRADLILEVQQLSERITKLGLEGVLLQTPLRDLSLTERLLLGLLSLTQAEPTDCLFVFDSPSEILNDQQLARLIDYCQTLIENGNSVLVVDAADRIRPVCPKFLAIQNLAESSDGHLEIVLREVPKKIARNKKVQGKGGAYSLRELNAAISASNSSETGTFDNPILCVLESSSEDSSLDETIRAVVSKLKQRIEARSVLLMSSGNSWRSNFLGRAHVASRSSSGPLKSGLPSTIEDELRLGELVGELFAMKSAARVRNLSAAAFVRGNKQHSCPSCAGVGNLRIEEGLRAVFEEPCGECLGSGYDPRVMEVTVGGLSVVEFRARKLSELASLVAGEAKLSSLIAAAINAGCGKFSLADRIELMSDSDLVRVVVARLQQRHPPMGRRLLVLDRVLDACASAELPDFRGVIGGLKAAKVSVLVLTTNQGLEVVF